MAPRPGAHEAAASAAWWRCAGAWGAWGAWPPRGARMGAGMHARVRADSWRPAWSSSPGGSDVGQGNAAPGINGNGFWGPEMEMDFWPGKMDFGFSGGQPTDSRRLSGWVAAISPYSEDGQPRTYPAALACPGIVLDRWGLLMALSHGLGGFGRRVGPQHGQVGGRRVGRASGVCSPPSPVTSSSASYTSFTGCGKVWS